jgi:hypothetical protein
MTDDDLLRLAAYQLRRFAIETVVVHKWLDVPYATDPGETPWTRKIGPRAKSAYRLSRQITEHLKEKTMADPPVDTPFNDEGHPKPQEDPGPSTLVSGPGNDVDSEDQPK